MSPADHRSGDESITRQKRLNSILELALDMTLEKRLPFIRQACDGDEAMFETLKALLQIEGDAQLWLPDSLSPSQKPGDRLGSWQLERQIDRGGMGHVWLANRADGAFEMKAAIKFISQDKANPHLIERFKMERQILADLIHPNICRLLDGGTNQHGEPYIVMEYVEGHTIDVWQKEAQPQIDAVLALFRKLCEAVAHAHHKGILHRDIKPSNIMVLPNGDVKLLDFGIAKWQHSDTDITKLHAEPYTPEYASPERLKGHKATKAADTYSLGLVLFQLLTGQRPRNVETSYRKAIHAWVAENPRKHKAAGNLLLRLTHIDPSERPTCAEDLLQLLDENSTMARFSPKRWSIVALLAIVVLSLTYGFTSKLGWRPLQEPTKSRLFPADEEVLGILVLPFQRLEDCAEVDVLAEEALVELFRVLAHQNFYKLDIRYDTNRTMPKEVSDARKAAQESGAYVVIWGNLYERCNSEHRIDLYYTFPNNRGFHRQEAQQFHLAKSDQKRLMESLDYLVTLAKGDRYFTRRQYRLAAETFEQIAKPEKSLLLEQIGLAYRYAGDEKKANEYYQMRSKNTQRSAFERARILQGLRRYHEAIEFYTKAVKTYIEPSLVYSNRGNCYWVVGEYDKAFADLNKAIEIRPDYDVAIHYRGCVYDDLGEDEKALADFQRVIDLNSLKTEVAHANRGNIFLRRGEIQAAIEAFNLSLEANPHYQNAYTYRGRAWLHAGDGEQAEVDFRKAIELEPRQAKTFWVMSKAYMENGQTEKVVDYLEQTLLRDAKNYYAFVKEEALFEPLHDDPAFVELLERYNTSHTDAAVKSP